jgi:peptidyl-prolyl cis-trans isomerase A (cyclophilin A)
MTKNHPTPRRATAALLLALLCIAPLSRAADEPDESASTTPPTSYATTRVLLKTDLGDISIELETQRAPITAQNFLRYADEKRFDGAGIYRAVSIGDENKYGLVQGGLSGDPQKVLPPIAHEAPAVTGLHSVDGAISMARNEPGSATADFFFIIGDLTSLDGDPDPAKNDPGYAVFGRVVSGMDLLRTILLLPRKQDAPDESMRGQMLQQPVKIISVRRDP